MDSLAPVSLSHRRDAADRSARRRLCRRADAAEHAYNDLLFKSATLLRRRADVCAALQSAVAGSSWTSFQDTDPVRPRSCSCWRPSNLRRGNAGGTAAVSGTVGFLDWRSGALRPGALFVVSDPKQSIYRFRRADIEVYNLVRARIAGNRPAARIIPLTTNFSSTAALCEWANRVFTSQFPSATRIRRSTPLEPAPVERSGHRRPRARADIRPAPCRKYPGVCTLTMGADVEGEVAAVGRSASPVSSDRGHGALDATAAATSSS